MRPSRKNLRSGSIAKYKYKSYAEYIEMQSYYASRRKTRTRSHEKRRQWIYDYLKDHDIEGDSVLCVGARDDSEVDFFTNKGHDTIGIDLYETRAIINCDMSKMYEHPKLKDMKFDMVFSLESLEHCLDIEGFVKGLNLVCKKYFVCMFGIIKAPNYWDCHQFDFTKYAGTNRYDEELIKVFPDFELVTNEVHKRGKKGFFILKKKSV